MMGQFVVTDKTSATTDIAHKSLNYVLHPNPASDRLFVEFNEVNNSVYYITISNVNGRTVMMLPQPEIAKGIDISALAKGIYFVQLMDVRTKSITSQKFVKE
jgi:hypothetical protein